MALRYDHRVKRHDRRKEGVKYDALSACLKCGGLLVTASEFIVSEENAQIVKSVRCLNCGAYFFGKDEYE